MNTVNYQGKKLKIIRFNDELYRADRGPSSNYSNAPMKYFTPNKNKTNSYANHYSKEGTFAYIKTWKPQNELVLIDILHTPTRDALAEIIGDNSLDIAFPKKGNKVSRVSEEGTKEEDYKILRDICALNIADGYYMDTLNNNKGEYVFHSEIGLCSSAFPKLSLIASEKNTKNPPGPPTKKRSRTTRNNNNKNGSPPTRKRFRATINNNKNRSPPKVRRIGLFNSGFGGPLSFN
jgi:hypothetical protein